MARGTKKITGFIKLLRVTGVYLHDHQQQLHFSHGEHPSHHHLSNVYAFDQGNKLWVSKAPARA